jgi:hypothetical protein
MDNQSYSATDAPAQTESIFTDVIDTAPYEKSMKNARIWLYVIAGLQFLMGIFEYMNTADRTIGLLAFGIDATMAVCFLVLALWSRKKPVIAFTMALVLYALFVITFSILDPSNIYKGIIVKILVVIALVKANKDARKYEDIKTSIGEPI